ncbi:hypothetical protein PCASD_19008 [Puccinia coronata f. sp. avenae]|uniref:Uncharacterized protein n=1 Tax=Puccinia coronata f. sp. avenae TaxID=200324 RepID=A0A2N5SIW8_9BASI|nr:hypothetical protein PCASD_19008 [Puccinia coronata f. sp. avenae]
MNNPNIVPNLENYHLDENGRILFTNCNHTSNVGASTQDQSLNGAHNNHGQQAEARIDLNNCISQGSADTVRQVSFVTGRGRRLTNRIKDELKYITLEYQKKIHELAITYELQSEIMFKWVGAFNKMKGPNRFNNYCRYGREPREIFASKQFPPGERMQQVGEKWRALDESKQLKYTDINFLNNLCRAMGLPGTDNPEDIEDKDCKEAGQIDAEFNRSAESGNLQIDLLASNVKVQQASKSGVEALKFNHLRADHQKLSKRATNLAQAKPWEAGEVPNKKKIMREHLRNMLFLKIKPEAVEPSAGVDLRKTLLDGNPSAYSKDQIHAVLEALHFKWILLNKKDPATATGTDSWGLQGTGSKQQVGGKGNKVGSKGNEVGGKGNEVGGKGNKVGANE